MARRDSEIVYFVEALSSGLIKIGVARDAQARLRTLQTGSPEKLSLVAVIRTHDASGLERALHAEFRSARSHGEWFHPVSGLLDFIVANGSTVEDDRRAIIQSAIEKMKALTPPHLRNTRTAKGALTAYKAPRGLDA